MLELIDRDAAGRPAVVFVTAYDQYAVKAFDANAVDYLLKPFDRARFDGRSIARAPGSRQAARRPRCLSAGRAARPLSRVVVKDGVTVTVLPGRQDRLREGRGRLRPALLGRTESPQEADAREPRRRGSRRERFVRIHRSYLLNLDRLVRVEGSTTGASTAVLIDGTSLPVSRAGAQRLRALLESP